MSVAAATSPPLRRPTPRRNRMSRFSARPDSAGVFAIDKVMWGVPIRTGFSELDDPWYHRGLTGHAFLVGDDQAALCGYQPRRRGFLSRRRPKLGLPSDRINPMCRECAQSVALLCRPLAVPVTPVRSRVPVPIRVQPAGTPRFDPTVVGSAPRR